MRAAEAVADFEKASAHAGDAEDGQGVPSRRVQSLTASEQSDVLWLSPGGEPAAWRACGDGTGASPSRQCQAASRWRIAPALTECRRPGDSLSSRPGEIGGAIALSSRSKWQLWISLRLRLADWRIRQPDLQGHHRPDQGCSRCDPERGLCCGAPDHHGSHGGRSAEEEPGRRRDASGWWRHGRHGRYGLLGPTVQNTAIRKARQQLLGLFTSNNLPSFRRLDSPQSDSGTMTV
jgi:hypothetical protein